MLIHRYDEAWLDRFEPATDGAAEVGLVYLLIDGVFVPGLHRLFKAALPASQVPSLLFETLPACSDHTRDVSPFLVQSQPSNQRFRPLLDNCSGWPMMCAIETPESQAELAARLAAWCVVEVDDQRFNFRFPDTRRLPAIFDALTPTQRAEFAGPAMRWSYIDRAGQWRELSVPGAPSAIADRPRLDDEQFGKLVSDSEADEVISMLAYRGHEASGSHSRHHATVSRALRAARGANLDTSSTLAWCESCLLKDVSHDDTELAERFPQWLASSSADLTSMRTKEPT
ncbi:MAG: hypothetical protein JWR65_4956 [Massilia sp.]|nr:hypothetical protein [Massilia sp.]